MPVHITAIRSFSGKRTSFQFLITGPADPEKRGVNGLQGRYLKEGENLLPEDSVFIEVVPTGSSGSFTKEVRVYRLKLDGAEEVTKAPLKWGTQWVTLCNLLNNLRSVL